MLHVGSDADPELIYQMIKWWDQNFDQIKSLHPSIEKNMTVDFNYRLFNETFLPTHEGTIRFFKEKGLWTEANQRRQDYLVKLVDLYTKAYQDALADAAKKGITVDPGNKDWTALWEDLKKARRLPPFQILNDAEISAAMAALK